jgi:hypothetical protein
MIVPYLSVRMCSSYDINSLWSQKQIVLGMQGDILILFISSKTFSHE